MPLEFVEIHQPVRHLKKDGEYFVCTDFRKPGSQDEYYDIDFWVNQKTGKLEVDNVKIHKVPVQEDGVWTQVPRYTFEGMDFRRHQLIDIDNQDSANMPRLSRAAIGWGE